jgi:hypothetical protein
LDAIKNPLANFTIANFGTCNLTLVHSNNHSIMIGMVHNLMGFTQKTKLRDDHAPISFGKQKPQCHGDA